MSSIENQFPPLNANNMLPGIMPNTEALADAYVETPVQEPVLTPELLPLPPQAADKDSKLPFNAHVGDVDTRFRTFPRRLGESLRTLGKELVQPNERAEAIGATALSSTIEDAETKRGLKGVVPRIFERFLNVTRSERTRRVGAFTLGVTAEAAVLSRGLAVVLPNIYKNIMTHGVENDWNGYLTGGVEAAAIGGAFLGFGYVTGKAVHLGMNKFPATTQKVVENHPAMVGSVARAIDGFPPQKTIEKEQPVKPEEGYDVGPYDTKKSVPGKVGLAAYRGPKTVLLFGTTPHAGIAKVAGHSNESVERRIRTVSIEGAGFLGGLAVGLTALIENDSLGLADKIMDAITNKHFLFGAQAAIIGSAAALNYVARRGERKIAQENIALQEQPALEAN